MDLIDKLKSAHSFHGDPLHREAWEEIERLREALKTFADNVKETNVGINKNWAETVYPLKAENQRLREEVKELEEIMDEENIAIGYLITKRALKKHKMWKQTDSK